MTGGFKKIVKRACVVLEEKSHQKARKIWWTPAVSALGVRRQGAPLGKPGLHRGILTQRGGRGQPELCCLKEMGLWAERKVSGVMRVEKNK